MVSHPTELKLRWALPFPRTGGALLAGANAINGPGQRTTLDPATTPRTPTVSGGGQEAAMLERWTPLSGKRFRGPGVSRRGSVTWPYAVWSSWVRGWSGSPWRAPSSKA